MPIIGLSDSFASFPRLGELRKGAPKPASGNKPGRDLDHFRFTSSDPAAVEAFRVAYGDEPQAVNCYLPYPTADENFESWVEEWAGGGLIWRGDGQQLVIWRTEHGAYSTHPKPQPVNVGKPVGRLRVIVPELRRLAYVVALTTSIHDIRELAANLRALQALRGSLTGIPMMLIRVPRMVSMPDGKGSRVRREKWLLHLEAAPAWVDAQLAAARRAALPSPADYLPELPQLPAPSVEEGGWEEAEENDPELQAEAEAALADPVVELCTDAQLAHLEELGETYYGQAWPERKKSLAAHFHADFLGQLTVDQAAEVAGGIAVRLKEKESKDDRK